MVHDAARDAAFSDVAVHCSGNLAAGSERQRIEHASARCVSGARGAALGALYDGFDAAGLQYGPSFRLLSQVWVPEELDKEQRAQAESQT